MDKEVLALGALFCEVNNEVSHLLRAKMKGTDGKEEYKLKNFQSIPRLSTINLLCLAARRREQKIMKQKNEVGGDRKVQDAEKNLGFRLERGRSPGEV